MTIKISYHDFLDFFEILEKIHFEKINIKYSEKIANTISSLFFYYEFYHLLMAQIVDKYDKNKNEEEYMNEIDALHSFVLYINFNDDIRFVFSSSFHKENLNTLKNYESLFLSSLKNQIVETQELTDFEYQTQKLLKKIKIN
jgi:hypothetical protein